MVVLFGMPLLILCLLIMRPFYAEIVRSEELTASGRQLFQLHDQCMDDMVSGEEHICNLLATASAAVNNSQQDAKSAKTLLLANTTPAFKAMSQLETFANYQTSLTAVTKASQRARRIASSLDQSAACLDNGQYAIRQMYADLVTEKRRSWQSLVFGDCWAWLVPGASKEKLSKLRQWYKELDNRTYRLEQMFEELAKHQGIVVKERARFKTLHSRLDHLAIQLAAILRPDSDSHGTDGQPKMVGAGIDSDVLNGRFLERMFLDAMQESIFDDTAAPKVEEFYFHVL